MHYKKLYLYLNTIRYLRPSQFFARIATRIKKNFAKSARYRQKRFATPPDVLLIRNKITENAHRDEWQGGTVFRFLNATLNTHGSWFPPEASQLWVYNLHYFGFLYTFPSWEQCRSLIQGWIEEVPILAKDAWHPYTVSLRICNWIWAYGFFAEKKGALPVADVALCNSIYNQARYVKDFLERDVLGNHLVENCKALIVAGVFLREPVFTRLGVMCLQRQLKEQILDDGGHYERSPMYHSIVLEDCIAMHAALAAAQHPFADELKSVIAKMADFLHQTLEPDGTIPLLNDSAYGIAPEPAALFAFLEQAKLWRQPLRPQRSLYKQSGVYLYRTPDISLTFDCGACCPDFLPAHAHADMLSYTLYFDGCPVVADSGVYEYTAGQWRDHFRSTRSHTTFSIDGKEQIECWAGFRVARRGYPRNVHTTENGVYAETTCYHFLGVQAARTVTILDKQRGVAICDTLQGARQCRSYQSFVHFAPDVTLRRFDTTTALLQTKDGVCIQFEASPAVTIQQGQSWYSPAFGVKQPRLCLTLSGIVPGKTAVDFWYRITKAES